MGRCRQTIPAVWAIILVESGRDILPSGLLICFLCLQRYIQDQKQMHMCWKDHPEQRALPVLTVSTLGCTELSCSHGEVTSTVFLTFCRALLYDCPA